MSRSLLPTLRAPAALSAGALPGPLPAWNGPGLFARLRSPAALSRPSRREEAQERLLEGMAERIARLEIALMRAERQAREQALRAEQAESSIIRLQSVLDGLRRHPAGRDGACPATLEASAP